MHRLTRKHVPLDGRQLKKPQNESERIENNEPARKEEEEAAGRVRQFFGYGKHTVLHRRKCVAREWPCVSEQQREEEAAADVQRRSSLSLSLAYVLIAFPSLKTATD